MNRTDFMEQLDRLLQDIPSAEREEALQYYNDYFDDAGQENEQAVMKALGNPARVAENIKRDLTESGMQARAKASDEALVEYGKVFEEENRQEGDVRSRETHAVGACGGESRSGGTYGGGVTGAAPRSERTYGGAAATGGNTGESGGYGGAGGPGGNGGSGYPGGTGGPGGAGGAGSTAEAAVGRRRRARPAWAVILIVTGAVFLSPLGLGLLSLLFGIVVCWLALIFSAGVLTLSLFATLIVLLVVGIMCIFVDPLVGVGLIGGGLVVGGLALLSLMLTVAMAGIVTPGIFRGIGNLFKWIRKL